MARKGNTGPDGAAALVLKGKVSIRVLTGSAAALILTYLGYLTYLVVNCMEACTIASHMGP